MLIKTEEIVGYIQDHVTICVDCVDEGDDLSQLTSESILTQRDVSAEDELWFCDRCNKRIV